MFLHKPMGCAARSLAGHPGARGGRCSPCLKARCRVLLQNLLTRRHRPRSRPCCMLPPGPVQPSTAHGHVPFRVGVWHPNNCDRTWANARRSSCSVPCADWWKIRLACDKEGDRGEGLDPVCLRLGRLRDRDSSARQREGRGTCCPILSRRSVSKTPEQSFEAGSRISLAAGIRDPHHNNSLRDTRRAARTLPDAAGHSPTEPYVATALSHKDQTHRPDGACVNRGFQKGDVFRIPEMDAALQKDAALVSHPPLTPVPTDYFPLPLAQQMKRPSASLCGVRDDTINGKALQQPAKQLHRLPVPSQ